ncbi:MAG TPA: hypothetical protein DDY38_00215 [Firmicutes bacterium]|nr:hypothetical protein [Bacillota bacterium]
MKLILACLYKELIYKKRYLVNTVITMILFCVIFIILIGGYSAISGSPFQFGESAAGLVVSYYAWTMMLSVYTSTGYIVYQNKQHGTLENIISNTRHFTLLLICESIVSSAIYFVFSWLIIGALTLIYGIKLHFMVFSVFTILMTGLLSVLGLSLIVAGAAMLFRRMDGIMSILQFALLGGLFLPESAVTYLGIPFYSANKMLMSIFIDGTSLLHLDLDNCIMLVCNSLVFLAAGILIFQLCLKGAKRRGTLSFY